MNFKIIIVLVSILFFCLNNCLLCQTDELSEAEIQYTIACLDSVDNYHMVNAAILGIAYDTIYQALDAVEQKLWNQQRGLQLYFLRAMHVLGSTKVHEYTLAFFDTLDTNPVGPLGSFTGPQYAKMMANEILFEYNDYSKANFVFEELDRQKPHVSMSAVRLLPKIIKNAPEYFVRAKQELLWALASTPYERNKFTCVFLIRDALADEALPQMIDVFISDSSSFMRRAVLEIYLSEYGEKFDLHGLIKERLPLDPDGLMRLHLAKILLLGYSTIDDYKYVKEYLSNEPEDSTKILIEYELDSFLPHPPTDCTETIETMLDTLISYINQFYAFDWLDYEPYKNELSNKLHSAGNYLDLSDSLNCAKEIKSFQESIEQVHADSAGSYPRYVSDDAYKFLYYYPQYILDRLPEIPEDTTPEVRLLNSSGTTLTGGTCQYYEGGWQTAADNGDGTFAIETDRTSLSIRMTYAYGTQTLSNVTWGEGPVIFQTVNAQVELKDSEDNLMPAPMGDVGTVKYYAGGWRDFGATENGIAKKELLPINYSFRMTYEYASNDKQQNLGDDPTVVFQTVPATVQLKNSQGNFIDDGLVKYYSGGWRDFGVISNGEVFKELLPNNYSFRMTYAFAIKDKQQNLNDNTTVVFQTVPATVQLKNSQGSFIDEGAVKYYSGGWRDFGVTSNGETIKELLPNNYSFRMTYAFASNDKQQNLNDNTTVVFQTVPATVQLKNSQGSFIDEGTVKYYSGGWREFGVTFNGETIKELLPNNYSFRMTYAFASKDKQQNLNDNSTVVFQTVPATVLLKDSQNNLMPAPMGDQGTVKYYSGGWRDLGATTNGAVIKELLPNNYSFRMTYAFASKDKQQNLNDNTIVVFQTVPATVQLRDSQNNLMPAPMGDQGTVQYYSGGWRSFGTTISGNAVLELLPNNYSFRMTHEFISSDLAQNIGLDNIVEFSTINCIVRVNDQLTQPIDGAAVSYYSGGWRTFGTTVNGEISKELLPKRLTFRASHEGILQDKVQDTSTNNIVEFAIGE